MCGCGVYRYICGAVPVQVVSCIYPCNLETRMGERGEGPGKPLRCSICLEADQNAAQVPRLGFGLGLGSG